MTNSWRQPTDDSERRPLFNGVKNLTLNHPGYVGRTHQDTPPSVRIGLRLACSPLAPWHPTTSELRRAFLRVLSQPPIADLVASMTHSEGLTWTTHDGHGRHVHGAVLTGGDQKTLAPTAWARVLLPDPNESSFWRDPQSADFILHIEPRTRRGEPAPAHDLVAWHSRFSRALTIPHAVATSLLTEELGLLTSDEPNTKVAMWLSARDDLTDLVDPGGYQRLPGNQTSPSFDAYAVASPDGQLPPTVAAEWMRQMCDNALHLDGYEPILLTLGIR